MIIKTSDPQYQVFLLTTKNGNIGGTSTEKGDQIKVIQRKIIKTSDLQYQVFLPTEHYSRIQICNISIILFKSRGEKSMKTPWLLGSVNPSTH